MEREPEQCVRVREEVGRVERRGGDPHRRYAYPSALPRAFPFRVRNLRWPTDVVPPITSREAIVQHPKCEGAPMAATQPAVVGRIAYPRAPAHHHAWDTPLLIALALAALLAILAVSYFAAQAGTDYPEPTALVTD